MRKKKNFQHDKYDTKTRWTIFEIKWIQIVFQATFDDFVDYFKIINEYKIISNFIFDLSFDILKMIYHLILKKKIWNIIFSSRTSSTFDCIRYRFKCVVFSMTQYERCRFERNDKKRNSKIWNILHKCQFEWNDS